MRVIKVLKSRRYAVTFIILITLSLVLATLVPQRARMSEAEWFRFRARFPEVAEFIHLTGLDHIYTTWWFLIIVGLFSLNIGLNLSERVGVALKQQRNNRPLGPEQIKRLSLHNILAVSEDMEQTVQRAVKVLRRFHYRVKLSPGGIYAYKGKIGYWWVPLFHGGLLTVIAGVLISGLFRFSGTFEISEGQIFYGREDEFISKAYGASGYRPEFDFSLRLKKFRVQYWDDKHPRLYQSIMEVLPREGEAFTKEVEMNKPLRYKGFSFYQTKYYGYSAYFSLVDKRGMERTTGYVNFPYRERYNKEVLKQDFVVPGTKVQAILELMPYNPASVKIDIREGLRKIWSGTLNEGDGVEIGDFWLRFNRVLYWTGIYVSKDPGVGVVYSGFVLIVLSTMGMVFVIPRIVWIAFGNGKLYIGAHAYRNKEFIEEEFRRIIDELKGAFYGY